MLRAIVAQLKRIPAPKTLVWISQGMLTDDRRPDIARIADEALAGRLTCTCCTGFDGTHGRIGDPQRDRRRGPRTMSEGLEFMAGVGRGALFHATGSAAFPFKQIANELARSCPC